MRVAIDAGHGSNTAGKRTPKLPDGTVIREHTFDVAVANLLDKELRRCNIQSVLVGWDDADASDDPDVALTMRQQFIKGMDCDAVVSIHANAAGDGIKFNDAQGLSVHIHNANAADSRALANSILKYLAQGTLQKNRGIHEDAFAMINCERLGVKAAVLCELAFMTNLQEAELLRSPKFIKECAAEIAQGVCAYLNVPYVLEGTKPPTKVTVNSPSEDIIWLQTQLTKCLKGYTIKITGKYDSPTRIAVLMYWEQLGWGKDMIDDGTTVGSATIKALLANRKE